MPRILVFGSINIDHIYAVEKIAGAGEHQRASSVEYQCGGKGLNEALAIAKAGADRVFMAGGIGEGNDAGALKLLQESGVDVSNVEHRTGPCGHTVIQVDRQGHHTVIACDGANFENTPDYIEHTVFRFSGGDWIVLQNEVNDAEKIVECAKRVGMRIAMCPSPYDESLKQLLKSADMIFVNRSQAQSLTNETAYDRQLSALHALYPKAVILETISRDGYQAVTADGTVHHQEEYRVAMADSSGTFDTLIGYFLKEYLETKDIPHALKTAAAAAAVCASRRGSSPSIPSMDETAAFLQKLES